MSKSDKILAKVLSGRSDANISFDDLCHLLLKLGYEIRSGKGSHVVFQKSGQFVNLQNDHGKAKSYQVRQVRELLQKLP